MAGLPVGTGTGTVQSRNCTPPPPWPQSVVARNVVTRNSRIATSVQSTIVSLLKGRRLAEQAGNAGLSCDRAIQGLKEQRSGSRGRLRCAGVSEQTVSLLQLLRGET